MWNLRGGIIWQCMKYNLIRIRYFFLVLRTDKTW